MSALSSRPVPCEQSLLRSSQKNRKEEGDSARVLHILWSADHPKPWMSHDQSSFEPVAGSICPLCACLIVGIADFFRTHGILFTIDRQTLQLLRFRSKSLKQTWNVLSQKLKSYWFQASSSRRPNQGLCLIFFVATVRLSRFQLEMENLWFVRSALQLQENCVNGN